MLRVVMRVDHHLAHAEAAQPRQRDFQQRPPRHLHQSLGAIVGEWTQPCSQPRSQHHGLQRALTGLSSPVPYLLQFEVPHNDLDAAHPAQAFARLSARYTERCCPPVQPNETIRFWKPRR